MGSEWTNVQLFDVVSISTKKIEVISVDLKNYISTDNMIPNFGGVILANNIPTVKKISSYKTGDILFSNIRTYFKKLWLSDRVGGCSNDVIVFNSKNNIDSKYLFYVLMNNEFIEYSVQTSKGTKMPRGDKEAMMRYSFRLPPLHEQQAIANILGSLDDRIELNRRMNETLEAMAQALFKSWFVDFDPVIDNALAGGKEVPEELAGRAAARAALGDKRKPLPAEIRALFPDEFVYSDEMGWIPKGWRISEIGNEVDVVGGGTPSTKNPDFWENGNYHWTTPKDLSGKQDKVLLKTERKITEAGLKKISSGLLPVDTVLLSSRAPIGYLALAKVPVAINQGYIAMKCNRNLPSVYILQWADSIMDRYKTASRRNNVC